MQRILTCGVAALTVALITAPGLAQSGTQSGHSQQQPRTQDAQPTGTTGTAGATVEKIADNPESWFGKKVTVRAKVGDVFSKKVFNVEEEGVIDVDDEVLIVAPKATTYLKADQTVTVTGNVRQFVRTDIETAYDGLDWDLAPELLLQFERRPVIVADSVTTAAGR